jgi:ABC-type glycerol-3-phosphate transport system substrate-binding protein
MKQSAEGVVTRRAILAALAAGAAAPVLAACSAAPGGPTTGPQATGAPGAGKPTLRLTHWWGEQFAQYVPIVTEKTGIQIQEERVPGSDYQQKLTTQLVAGVGPDLMLLDTYWNGDIFSSGYLLPLDDRLKAANLDMSKFNVDQKKEVGYQGKTMGLSVFTAQDIIVHVNADLADKSGILKNLPLWGTPAYDTWTWNDFVEWLKAGTKVKGDGTVEQYGLAQSFGSFGGTIRAVLAQHGGSLFDDDWNYTETKTTIDQELFLETVQMTSDLLLKHQVTAPLDAEKAIQGGNYRAQRAVAAVSWSTPSIFTGLQNQVYFHLPFTKKKAHRFGANHLAINQASKQLDASTQFLLTFLTDKDARTKFFQVSSVPAYDPLPIVQASLEGTPKTIGLINLSRIKGMSTLPANTEGVEVYPGWLGRKPQLVANTLTAAVESVMIGKASVKEAFTQAKATIDAELAKK